MISAVSVARGEHGVSAMATEVALVEVVWSVWVWI